MDVGLLSLGDLMTDPVTGIRRTAVQRHRSLVDQAVLAEQVGFTSVHLGEHHFCDYIVSAPAVVLAAIAERTTTLKLSTGVTLGVNLDPVRIAEDYATVDVLSNGRVEPVIGRGTFFPHTFDAFGQDPRDAKDVFAENVELLCRLWREENVTWTGSFRSPVTELTTQPRPVNSTGPAMWIGGGVSMESVDLAARLGLRLMLPTVFGTLEMFRPAVDRYLEQWEASGRNPADRHIGSCNHCFVHPTNARATWEPRYRAYIEWVNDLVRTSTKGVSGGLGHFDFDRLTANTALCGTVDEVVDRMGVMAETLHLDTQILMFDMGGLPDEELYDVIARVGNEMIPQLASM